MTVDEVLAKIKNEYIQTVIFDFDNTICDMIIDWDDWYEGIHEIFRSYDPSFHKLTKEKSEANLQNEFMEKYGEELRAKLIDFAKEYEEKYATGCNPRENVITLIKKLEKVTLWVWSTNVEKTVKKYLTEIGLVHRFSKFITRDSVDFIKPNPNGFFKVAGNDANKLEFLMIGNSNNDKKAAEAAGISYIDENDIRLL